MINAIYNDKTILNEKIGIRVAYYEKKLKAIQGRYLYKTFINRLNNLYPEGSYTADNYEKLIKRQIQHEKSYFKTN